MEDDSILLENGESYLTENELSHLTNELKKHNIELETLDSKGPKQSFNDICIYISSHITELIMYGLLVPTAYDVLKCSLKFIVYKIKDNIKILQSRKVLKAQPCIRFKTCNGEIMAPIPQDLSENQFDEYMDGVWKAVQSVKPNPEVKYEPFIIERNENSLKIEVKTLLQYAQEQCDKQEQEGINNTDKNNSAIT